MHTLTGLAHDRSSRVAYDPEINEQGMHARSLKLAALQKTLTPPAVFGEPEGDLLVVGWGSTKGAIEESVERLRREGHNVSSLHLGFLQPMQPGIKEILQRFRQVITIEANWSDDPRDELIDETNRRYLGARDAAARPLPRGRRLLERSARPADQARYDLRGLAPSPGARGAASMSTATVCLHHLFEEHRELEDYQGGVPRWCKGCGDNAILAAMQRLCRDEGLRPEKTVFVSGIGCSSRLPHYMRTYGFHGIHGRALPIAEGIKLARPDLHVFVNTGDGDCCSIGAAHWIHAIRYNMNLTVLLHDNHIYGLTKKQASPTSPVGTKSNTTPRGSYLDAMSPLTVTLGIQNASFVAQAVDWIPEVAVPDHHRGVPSPWPVVRAHPAALPGVRRQHVRAVGARSAAHADADPRGRDQGQPRAAEDLPQPGRARSVEHRPRPRDRVERGPDPGRHPVPQPRRSRATRTCGAPGCCALPARSARRSSRNSTSSPSGRNSMDSHLRAQVVFHLTGRRGQDEAQQATLAGLRPALMSAYRDLESLRYDFPVILGDDAGEYALSLSDVVDAALRAVATPGVPGEGVRRRTLRIEREIRRLAARGTRGTLRSSGIWR